MSINPSGATAVPLTVFGSWVTEVSPDAVPENISPDCGDVVYAPGSVGSRPALQKVFNPPFPSGGPNGYEPTIVYAKSFVTPYGDIKNLSFDSNGSLWVEDLTNSPGMLTGLLSSTPGSLCRSCTAFGREYIAISDGLHGTDVPCQYDGTNFDRVTMNGPAAPPVVASVIIPATTLTSSSMPSAQTIVSIVSSGEQQRWEGPSIGYVTFWTTITVTLQVGSTVPAVGTEVTISGNSYGGFNQTLYIQSVTGLVLVCGNLYQVTANSGTGGTLTALGGVTLVRTNNQVSATTATNHNLKIGYQAQITGMDTLTVGTSISSIVIDNETLPGIATVTTATAHGLEPQNDVTITGVTPARIGSSGGWTGIRNGYTVTLTLGSGSHSLVPGSNVQVTDTAADDFQGTFTIALVPSPNQIVYYQSAADATATSMTVAITWPIPDDTPTPTYFEVQSCPTPTTFQVQVTYADGTWASGSVAFPWNGTFFVTSVPSATSFTYLQYGPNGSSTVNGTVTPFGQCAPGLHLCQVLWLTRQGYISAPSPPVTFIAQGGQYVSVTNIPVGPANVIARILAFTGAQPNVPGELPPFFYIPVPAQNEGQIVSTSTVVNDNAFTSAFFDFSDNTLFSAIGLSIPGNTVANQIVLDGALGFGEFSSRLTTWGQRNYVQNLLNMAFDGGQQTSNPAFPCGWTVGIGPGGGVLTGYRLGQAWKIQLASTGTQYGQIFQGCYEDAYGDPILNGNTLYSLRVWAQPIGVFTIAPEVYATISSASTSFTSTCVIPIIGLPAQGGYVQGNFTTIMPVNMPNDMVFTVAVYGATAGTATVTLDEMGIFPTLNPYTDEIAYGSYVDNPEGMDGKTGQFGADDPSKLMDMGILRDSLYLLTQAPSGRLHYTDGSSNTEPAGWVVDEVAANCGTLSAFAMSRSQADDTAASGGDDWFAWASEGGAYIFGGGMPEKITQEIQPNWYDPTKSNTAIQINMGAALTAWCMNDPVQRLLMFGLPIGTATAPSKIYVLNYRNLGSAAAIAGSPPFHPSFAGKLIATDNSRKWAPWILTMNSAARIYRVPGSALTTVLCGGNGQAAGDAIGFGNIYTLNPAKLTDDDYGQIFPYYTTYAFLDPEKAMAIGLPNTRLLMAYIQAQIQGTGEVTLTYYPDSLMNPWALTTTRTLTSPFYSDRQFGGGMCTGDRIFIKIASSPITGTDNGFTMTRLTAYLKPAHLRVSGVNQ